MISSAHTKATASPTKSILEKAEQYIKKSSTVGTRNPKFLNDWSDDSSLSLSPATGNVNRERRQREYTVINDRHELKDTSDDAELKSFLQKLKNKKNSIFDPLKTPDRLQSPIKTIVQSPYIKSKVSNVAVVSAEKITQNSSTGIKTFDDPLVSQNDDNDTVQKLNTGSSEVKEQESFLSLTAQERQQKIDEILDRIKQKNESVNRVSNVVVKNIPKDNSITSGDEASDSDSDSLESSIQDQTRPFQSDKEHGSENADVVADAEEQQQSNAEVIDDLDTLDSSVEEVESTEFSEDAQSDSEAIDSTQLEEEPTSRKSDISRSEGNSEMKDSKESHFVTNLGLAVLQNASDNSRDQSSSAQKTNVEQNQTAPVSKAINPAKINCQQELARTTQPQSSNTSNPPQLSVLPPESGPTFNPQPSDPSFYHFQYPNPYHLFAHSIQYHNPLYYNTSYTISPIGSVRTRSQGDVNEEQTAKRGENCLREAKQQLTNLSNNLTEHVDSSDPLTNRVNILNLNGLTTKGGGLTEAFQQLLKGQVELIENYINASQELTNGVRLNCEPSSRLSGYGVTLEQTKEYIRQQRKPALTMETALQMVKDEEDRYSVN